MTVQTIDDIEMARLWKDPEARWELEHEACPPHPAGEITLRPSDTMGGAALRMLGITVPGNNLAITTFGIPSVSGPCHGFGLPANDRR